MNWLIVLLSKLGSNPAGQAFLSWLATKLWNYVTDETKNFLAKDHWEKHVKEVLLKYDAVINEAHEKAQDGLTEEEKNDIRQKKIALETELLNATPPKS